VTLSTLPDPIAWAHDTRADPRLPASVVRAWLEANGVIRNRTVRIEILAGDPPLLRWWEIDERVINGASCCHTADAVHRNHRVGPYTTPLLVPLPAELVVLDGGT
jgi:hypothetical protein